eukprot:TRINITY_DN49714_c0_g1_i11.p1 TRINITY_DN49714_c0_g1~~TRINITY_DN49714_c0_g1_i11.p1  ORF type:complete len:104 (-),score=10.81 TRINITY_DN49714_c0_g1_i11:34-345(-)
MMLGYSKGRVVFDRYLDESLKNTTQQKRADTPTDFEIHPEIKLTMSLNELLSGSKSERSLLYMFAQVYWNTFPETLPSSWSLCTTLRSMDVTLKNTRMKRLIL